MPLPAAFRALAALGGAAVLSACGSLARPTPTVPPAPELVIVTVTPGPPPGAVTPRAETVYVVQDGDTLSAIAASFQVSEDDLMAANGITDPNRLFAGQELRIPAVGGS